MRIKSIITVLSTIVLLVIPCVSGCILPVSGSGNLITEQFNYTDFDSIQISNVFEVEISQSDTCSISVTADDNIMDYVIVSRSGSTLLVRLEQGYNYQSITAIAKISLPDISELTMSGAAKGILKKFNTSRKVEIDVSGASELEIMDLTVGTVDIDVSGASVVRGTVACGDAEFNISGASTMNVAGSGQDLTAEVSGASKLELDNFTVNDVDIEVSGASNAVVNMDGTLNAEVSGASSLHYIGNPVMGDIDISGASSVRKK